MQRFARAAYFMGTIFIIILGIALCSLAMNYLVNTSPELMANLLPKDVLYITMALGFIHLGVGAIGCGAGYRQTRPFIVIFSMMLLIAAAVHVTISFVAQHHANNAENDVTQIWNKGSQESRALLESQLHCCGFTQTDIGAPLSSSPGTPPCNQSTTSICLPLMITFWEDAMVTAGAFMLSSLVIPGIAFITALFFWWNCAHSEKTRQPIVYQRDEASTYVDESYPQERLLQPKDS
ncbi:hypothetical protein BATDEDRAFT_86027 [Batrachochytrium dendrobatidis JAM81]|uniref:Tetraspanin n=2 Tax=Batrachochytrium dendrobatidis TaxID=109871 RepID=F4NUI8_BATDJ|nr:uncharacterized protein BATDEDRAFT_86027 [Batrachochytrium dendrobatidis JAM81]EGF83614.1 hypothetical protein BATDEDRAFT_86027 [Batrachochytrium dendrobatidis JAM81]KAJ8327354.1 hypothetical protein O5D80_004746 [Batrachochytrium dendrobatidis]KAK5665259.1 hypothetical protein QVD99_008103 [Batrachochytrium dendrobatidis]OAJ37462.1 hypothetical protein BDEG_21478 [Batrachochytrium dendrobatidis JEL423]|eukprot:XP_006676157.1 hypothetical protein BATDEDRAFT_86027 [Batrachochytrium dendrobatidis JAM81]